MTAKLLRDYCLSKLGAKQEFPFGPETEVFKVGGKIFAILYEDYGAARISLKCEPALADMLRQRYNWVNPGYHMNKLHWNTLYLSGDNFDEDFADEDIEDIYEQIDHSHELIFRSLTKKTQKQLEAENHPL